jgi:diketogulonate reductase-like aldo/keto reductase
MILEETYTLSNDVEIPKLGLGTWMIDNDAVDVAVQNAISIGYRHIDTAQAYQNEAGVAEGIRASGIPRDEIFVTTKLDAGIKSYEEAVSAIDTSLERMGLETIDMMIIHSPKPWQKFHEDEPFFEGNRQAWRALEEAYDAGKLRAIGLSNFEKRDVENILESCSIEPMVNQVLAHIGNTPFNLIDYCQDEDILVEAYSPIAHGELVNNEQAATMAESYGVSVPQLSIRYVLQLGLLPLPKSTNPDHMTSNAEIDFEISDDDMAALNDVVHEDYGDASMMPVFGGTLGD